MDILNSFVHYYQKRGNEFLDATTFITDENIDVELVTGATPRQVVFHVADFMVFSRDRLMAILSGEDGVDLGPMNGATSLSRTSQATPAVPMNVLFEQISHSFREITSLAALLGDDDLGRYGMTTDGIRISVADWFSYYTDHLQSHHDELLELATNFSMEFPEL